MDETEQRQDESLQMMRVRVAHNLVTAFALAFYFARLFRTDLSAAVMAGTLAVIPFAVLAEVLERKVDNFAVFTAGFAAGLAAVFFLPSSLYVKIPVLIICAVITALSYYARIQECYLFYPQIGWLFAGILLYALAAAIGSGAAGTVAFVYEVVTAGLALAYRSEMSCEYALGQIPKGGTIPYGEIRKAYNGHLTRWTVGGGAALLILYIAHSGDALFRAMQTLLKEIAYLFLRLVVFILSHFPQDESTAAEEAAEQLQFTPGEGEAVESSPLFQWIYRIIMILLIAAAVLFVLTILRYVFKSLYTSFRGAQIRGTDKAEFYAPRQQASSGEEGKEEDRIRFFDRSPAAGIRRSYIKLIRSGTHVDEIRVSDTPRELEDRTLTIRAERREAGDLVHRLYEKARYVPEECTAEDFEKMKSSVKILREG